MMMNQLLQSITTTNNNNNNNNNNTNTNNNNTNTNTNNGNDQTPSFLSILDAYQREKTMNEMIFQSLLSSSLQQQSSQQNQQQQSQPSQQQNQQQQQGHSPNYAALLAAATAQNKMNQQQQLLQQALMGRPINTSLPALMPSSANTVSDTALLALLQSNRSSSINSNMGNNALHNSNSTNSNSNNGASHAPGASAPTSQAGNSSVDSITSAPAPWGSESKLLGDNKIDIASALNGNLKASSLMSNLKVPVQNSGLNTPAKNLSTMDTAALLRLLTSAKAGGPTPTSNMMQHSPAPMASNMPAPAPATDAALLGMIQRMQQQQQQQQQQQPKLNNMPNNNTGSPSSTRASSPEHAAADFKSALGASRVVNSLMTPTAAMRGGAKIPSNPTSNLAMAVEIASSNSKTDSNNKNKNNKKRSAPPTTGSVPSFIDTQNEDVLFGKGRTKHQGNRHLQKLIENLMAVYEAANKQQKKELADMVVTKILNSGGRFLKLDEEAQRWDEVEREDAHKKVAHAFRNLRRRNK